MKHCRDCIYFERDKRYSFGYCENSKETHVESDGHICELFKPVALEQKDRPLTKRELDLMFAAKDK